MAGRPVWPGIFPGARLERAHKAEIIEAVKQLRVRVGWSESE